MPRAGGTAIALSTTMNNTIRSIRSKSLNRNQTRFQLEHETCVLCSTVLVLKFENIKDETTQQPIIREIAECPACTIKARSIDHPLN